MPIMQPEMTAPGTNMKISALTLKNFRCFGDEGMKIAFEKGVTVYIGANASGKSTVFLALSRLFGVTQAQRAVRKQDFHVNTA